jgi:hypothetical protein
MKGRSRLISVTLLAGVAGFDLSSGLARREKRPKKENAKIVVKGKQRETKEKSKDETPSSPARDGARKRKPRKPCSKPETGMISVNTYAP